MTDMRLALLPFVVPVAVDGLEVCLAKASHERYLPHYSLYPWAFDMHLHNPHVRIGVRGLEGYRDLFGFEAIGR